MTVKLLNGANARSKRTVNLSHDFTRRPPMGLITDRAVLSAFSTTDLGLSVRVQWPVTVRWYALPGGCLEEPKLRVHLRAENEVGALGELGS